MEAGGVVWVLAEQQQHCDATQACPGKEMYLHYRALITLSKRRCPLEEDFFQGETGKKLQVTAQAGGTEGAKAKLKGLGEGGGSWRFLTTRYPQSAVESAKQGGDNFDPKSVLKHS